jgi:acyl-CoA synthetase (AMP-forming)/AMP-acid ligase II
VSIALLAGETLGASLTNLARSSSQSLATFPERKQVIRAAELDEAATCAAGTFLKAGVRGELVGVLVDTAPTFFITLFGLWRSGAALSVLPAPGNPGRMERVAQRIAGIIKAAALRYLVVDHSYARLADQLRVLVPEIRILNAERTVTASGARVLPAVEPADLAVVQFTSGSTGTPKGVMLTHKAVMAGLRACVVAGEFSRHDVFIQWVPTFHDMGLIGLLSHWLNGADVHVFTPATFLRRPTRFLQYFAEHRGTVMTGPNFSYDHLVASADLTQLAADGLSSWRLAFNGAEPVSPRTVRAFTEKFAAVGVAPPVIYPVYGMAEATLAVCFPRPGSVARVIDIDRADLSRDADHMQSTCHDKRKQVVSVGFPVHGIDIRVVDEKTGADSAFGEIQIKGQAVTTGYYGDATQSQALFAPGDWLRTGDLGYLLDGELFVMGRRKEMIIVHGQNFFPEDVESIVHTIPGVYQKRCVAFPVNTDYAERMGIVAEVCEGVPADDLRKEIVRRVAGELALSHIDVHLVEPKWLTRTTSGKWQRSLAAQRIATRTGM